MEKPKNLYAQPMDMNEGGIAGRKEVLGGGVRGRKIRTPVIA